MTFLFSRALAYFQQEFKLDRMGSKRNYIFQKNVSSFSYIMFKTYENFNFQGKIFRPFLFILVSNMNLVFSLGIVLSN